MKSINDLNRVESGIKEEIKSAVSSCVESGWYVLGKSVDSFEAAFADYSGVKQCISVANGTQAIEIALRAAGVNNGDEVITAANAGFYSSIAILSCGAVPIYCDVNSSDNLAGCAEIEAVISRKTKAVILTHLYGRMADAETVKKLCVSKGIKLIEDCAQSHGARRGGKMTGSIGDIGCFSFYPTKNLGAFGDAGAIVTNDDILAGRIRQLRQYGWGKKYHVEIPGGTNSRMDELQAAVLLVKLKYLDQWNEKRRTLAAVYNEVITNPVITGKPALTGSDYVAHLYVIETEYRESLMEYLKQKGIPCDIHYPVPDHKQAAVAARYSDVVLPVTEEKARRVLTLPCFPEMTPEEAREVSKAINEWRPK